MFPSFRNLRKVLLAIFFCPVTLQSNPNVSGMPSLFRKQFGIEGCLPFLRTLVYRSQTARKTLSRGFLDMSSFFTRFSNKIAVFMAFRFPNLPTCFKNIRISRLHRAFSPLLVRNIRLVQSRYFLSGYLSGYFFIRIATGSTFDSHPLSVNARPIWINIYPTLYLSDSHPLSVNLAELCTCMKASLSQLAAVYCLAMNDHELYIGYLVDE